MSDCILWQGTLNPEGYAREGRTYVHRKVYEEAYGPIPEGHQIDHLCRNRGCVNPSHLEAVTQQENILRGESPSAVHARKTHCLRGHEFDRTRRSNNGKVWRVCSRCQRIRDRERGTRPTTRKPEGKPA